MSLWVARVGRYGEREDLALQSNISVIGWDDVGDLSRFQDRKELAKAVEAAYPDANSGARRNWVSQLWAFSHTMKEGDLVALPLKHRSVIAFGEVAGTYRFEKDNPSGARQVRPVKSWIELPRKAFKQDLLYSFGGASTVFQVKRNQAEQRVRKVLAGGTDTEVTVSAPAEEPGDSGSVVDLAQLARDGISEYIDRKFKGHGMARLVGAILQAQGYKVRVSPSGPDDGVDIIAGRGALGFESPRLIVQVKSVSSPIDVTVLRELQGVLSTFGAEQGLIVATGGYKSSVEREAARQYFKVRIWDADDLVQMIQDHYDHIPEDIKAELPLKRVWMLVSEEE